MEVDEIFLGGPRSGKPGHGAEGKTLVLIAAQEKEHHIGRIRLRRISDASSSSLHSAIQKTIARGSVIRTDGWCRYCRLDKLGFTHQISRQGEGDVGENLLPLANRVAALLKRWLLGTHQGAPRTSYLNYYLDEFIFTLIVEHPHGVESSFIDFSNKQSQLLQSMESVLARHQLATSLKIYVDQVHRPLNLFLIISGFFSTTTQVFSYKDRKSPPSRSSLPDPLQIVLSH